MNRPLPLASRRLHRPASRVIARLAKLDANLDALAPARGVVSHEVPR